MFYVYFLKSLKNNKIYTGVTEKDPAVRLLEHLEGTNAWSRRNGPFELLYYESYYCKTDALHREKFYKTGFGRKVRDAILVAVSAL
jgi:putative endonuclease